MPPRESDKCNGMTPECELMFKTINGKLDAIHTCVSGPPDAPERGLKIRLDRLEQTERSRSRWFWTSITAIASLLAETVWQHLRSK